jgi:[protein-PII] uridylyltransferase
MKYYYRVAKDVGNLTRTFCAALEVEQQDRPGLRLLWMGSRDYSLNGFTVVRGRLDIIAEDTFETDPVKMIELFGVAQQHELDIHPHALRLITRSLKKIDAAMRANRQANRYFLEILISKKDPETTLRRMNEAGVLGRFILDFGRVVAQMQHDMYHVYTVDEHTVFAVGILSGIESGKFADELPLATELSESLLSREVLYLALFLHCSLVSRASSVVLKHGFQARYW